MENNGFTAKFAATRKNPAPKKTNPISGKPWTKKFLPLWMTIEHFKDWLRPWEADETKCLCIACKIILNAGKSELEKHCTSIKHSRRMHDFITNSQNAGDNSDSEVSINPDLYEVLYLSSKKDITCTITENSNIALKWTKQVDLLCSLSQLLDTQSFVDVSLAVEGELIKAHKVILSASSPYFNTILQSNPQPHPVIFMRDVKFGEIRAIIDFIYRGEVIISQENAMGFFKTAEALQIKGLSEGSNTEVIESAQTSMEGQPPAGTCNSARKQASVIREVGNKKRKLDQEESLESLLTNLSQEEGSNSPKLISDRVCKVDAQGSEFVPTSKSTTIVTDSSDENKVTVSVEGKTLMVLEAPAFLGASTKQILDTHHTTKYSKDDMQYALKILGKEEIAVVPMKEEMDHSISIPVASLTSSTKYLSTGNSAVISYRQLPLPEDQDISKRQDLSILKKDGEL